MKTCLHCPINYVKPLKLQILTGDLDLPERRKRYDGGRKEEDEDAQVRPCGTAKETRTHIVRECEAYKEERDVLEEMRQRDKCEAEKYST